MWSSTLSITSPQSTLDLGSRLSEAAWASGTASLRALLIAAGVAIAIVLVRLAVTAAHAKTRPDTISRSHSPRGPVARDGGRRGSLSAGAAA